MKKIMRKILPVTVGAAALVVGSLYMGNPDPDEMSVLLLENIEALASGEDSARYFCYGVGSVDCPNGKKVEIVRTNFSLDDYE